MIVVSRALLREPMPGDFFGAVPVMHVEINHGDPHAFANVDGVQSACVVNVSVSQLVESREMYHPYLSVEPRSELSVIESGRRCRTRIMSATRVVEAPRLCVCVRFKKNRSLASLAQSAHIPIMALFKMEKPLDGAPSVAPLIPA